LKVLEGGVSAGVFKADADVRLMHTFIRDALWVTIRWWRPDGRYSIDEVADRYVDLIFHGLLADGGPGGNGTSAAEARRPARRSEVT
jgi:hypothetical protein